MNAILPLVRHSLRRLRGLVIAVCVTFFLLEILMVLVARSFELAGQFSQITRFIPSVFRALMDQSFLASLSFAGMVSFAYSHPIVLILLTAQAIAAGSEPIGELESKFVDLLMSRPVPRYAPILRSAIVVVVITVITVGSIVAGTVVGLALLAPPGASGPGAATVSWLALNLVLLIVAWGGITLAVGSFVQRRATTGTITGLMAFATFILDFLGRLWSAMAPLAWLSPFHYYTPIQIVIGEPVNVWHLLALATIAAVATGIALVMHGRRDL